jgi:PAS domain S-box-containing protein
LTLAKLMLISGKEGLLHTAGRSGSHAPDWDSGLLSSELLRRVLEAAPDGMLIADASGSIVFANRQITALFGYFPEELLAGSVERLIPERFRTRHVVHRGHYGSNPRVRPMGSGLELFGLRKDGSEFPVEISLSPVTQNGQTFIVAGIRDVTERREIQIQLRRAREEADRANQSKSRFLATASHDLRQPVQSLALLSGTLRRMTSDEKIVEAIEQQECAIGAMSRLLNALLDISKLESGAIRPEVTDFKVGALFEEVRAEFAGVAASKGLRLGIEPCGYLVRSDPTLVGQAVRNLVANAIKYTREGHVLLRCQHEGSCVRIEVEDTGIGIPVGELARICDDFYQIGVPGSATRQGYGLGLSIVSRIANLLGLKLEIRSEFGKGSVFSLELPAVTAAKDTAAAMPRTRLPISPGSAARAHILLVEDDPGVRNATRMLLRVEGHEVSTAASLGEALQQASEHADISMIVSDYHLGAKETGIQVVYALREILGPDLKAILVTGDTSSAMHALACDSNLRAASKPVNADELLGLVNELLQA